MADSISHADYPRARVERQEEKQQKYANGHDGEARPAPLWNSTPLSDWENRKIPPRQWIMEDWIPCAEYIGLYGLGGVRKTDWLLQLLMAAAVGLAFCGIPLMHCKTYGLFCEDSEEEIVRRCRRIADFYKRSLWEFTGFHFASLVGVEEPEFVTFDGGRMLRQPAFHLFSQQIEAHAPNLIGLDTIADVFGGEEITRRQVTQFVHLLNGSAKRHNSAIIGTRHPSQRGRREGLFDSGSTAWEGKERARLVLRDPAEDDQEDGNGLSRRIARTPSDKRILTRAKSNYARPGEELELLIRDGGFSAAGIDPSNARSRGHIRDLEAEAKFLALLRKTKKQGRFVHDSRNNPDRYAPKVFYADPDRGNFSEAELKRAMNHLFDKEKITMSNDRHPKIVETQ
jgi:RecA-family ATPase